MGLPIIGQSWGTPKHAVEVAIARGAKRPDFLRRYAENLWRDCATLGIRADVAWPQADVETGNRQTGIGFQSDRWVKEGNPAGLGVVDNLPDGTPVHTFTPETAARIHATHLAGYAGIAPPVEWVEMDFRWKDMLRAGYYGVATTTDDLGGRWATGKDYGPKVESRWKLYGFTEPQKEQGDMAFRQHRFVGLNADVPIPDDIPVRVSIVPASVRNVRSNQPFSGQTEITEHETANYNRGAGAEMHRRWLHNGAGGSYVGFNFVVDDKEIIQLTPLNEVTWHAGTPEGNKYSWGIEICVNADANLAKARANAAALTAGLCVAKGWGVRAVVQHNKWWGKNCPAIIRRDELWPSFIAAVDKGITAAKGGTTAPTFPPGVPIAEVVASPNALLALKNGASLIPVPDDTQVRATRPTRRLQYATEGAEDIGPIIAAGERFTVTHLIVNPDGSLYWLSPWDTRIRFEDTSPVESESE